MRLNIGAIILLVANNLVLYGFLPFQDRHWTTREFEELTSTVKSTGSDRRILLEIGCGVGNFVFPLLKEETSDFFIYACDFSNRAVQIVKSHPLYDESKVLSHSKVQIGFWD